MKTEYCIEFKLKDEPFYRKSFSGFCDKGKALELARNRLHGEIERVRVVEQTRKSIKVFK